MRKLTAAFLLAMFMVSFSTIAFAQSSMTRIKDIAKIEGVRSNQLVGYGLVVGLPGTGDSDKISYTVQSIVNMMKTFGITVSSSQLKAKNVAAVMVTAELPAFVKQGDTIDVTVSSMGDAKSLAGGTLLQSPLRAANGQVYAVGQGPLAVGGYAVSSGGSKQQKNFPTVGTIPNGGIVERDVAVQVSNGTGTISLALNQPDFTTAARMADVINANFGSIAVAHDAGTVTLEVPGTYGDNLTPFIAAVEELSIEPDSVAKVIINERTGTVVMGGNVTIDEVAVAQGGLSIKITKNPDVSQPEPFSGGHTAITSNPDINANEEANSMIVLPAATNVSDVVAALNAVGATPRDIIAILQAMKAAGALHADLQII